MALMECAHVFLLLSIGWAAAPAEPPAPAAIELYAPLPVDVSIAVFRGCNEL